jgi:hypothetical protein
MGLPRYIAHASQEKLKRDFPAPMLPDFAQQGVIGLAVGFKVEAEI